MSHMVKVQKYTILQKSDTIHGGMRVRLLKKIYIFSLNGSDQMKACADHQLHNSRIWNVDTGDPQPARAALSKNIEHSNSNLQFSW